MNFPFSEGQFPALGGSGTDRLKRPKLTVSELIDYSVIVSWGDVESATGYSVLVNGIEKYSGSNLTYEILGLNPWVRNSIQVKAFNVDKESSFATYIKPSKELTTPILTLESKTDTRVSMVATNPDSLNMFELYQNGLLVSTGNVFTFSLEGLSPDTSYEFMVRVGDGETIWSDMSEMLRVITDKTDTEAPGIISIRIGPQVIDALPITVEVTEDTSLPITVYIYATTAGAMTPTKAFILSGEGAAVSFNFDKFEDGIHTAIVPDIDFGIYDFYALVSDAVGNTSKISTVLGFDYLPPQLATFFEDDFNYTALTPLHTLPGYESLIFSQPDERFVALNGTAFFNNPGGNLRGELLVHSSELPNDQFMEFTLGSLAVTDTLNMWSVRITDRYNYYGLRLRSTGELQLIKVVADAHTHLGNISVVAVVGKVYRLEAQGAELRMYADGVLIGTHDDSDVTSGRAGMFVVTSNTEGQAAFTRFACGGL